jgi:hypothetical protein
MRMLFLEIYRISPTYRERVPLHWTLPTMVHGQALNVLISLLCLIPNLFELNWKITLDVHYNPITLSALPHQEISHIRNIGTSAGFR